MITLIMLSLLSFYSVSGTMEASEIRTVFHAKQPDEKTLVHLMKVEQGGSAVTDCYIGVCSTMYAEYATWPLEKLEYFNDGKKILETKISTLPKNPELRYLRLMVQLNTPSFLGYNESIEDDINVFSTEILKYNVKDNWKRTFILNLLNQENLSSTHKSVLVRLKRRLK